MLSRASFAFLVAAFTLVACSSIPELRFGDADGGPPVGSEGGVDSGDSGVDPNCVKTGEEVCDDGLDNDCDGKIDCADSQCTAGFSCQDAPADWTVIGFAPAATPGCPATAAATDLKVAAGDGSASCSCSCQAVGSACNSGNFTLEMSAELTCGVGPTTASVPKTGNCAALPASFNFPAGGFARIAAAMPTGCSAVSPVNGPVTNGRACQAAKFGKGCAENQVCAPKPAAGFTSCVAKNGKSVCPATFTRRSTAGTTAADTRTCTGCACNPPTACSGGNVSVYGNSMCKTAGANEGAEGIVPACAAGSPDSGFTATHFSATPATGGCGAPTAQATASGTLVLENERTVCCK